MYVGSTVLLGLGLGLGLQIYGSPHHSDTASLQALPEITPGPNIKIYSLFPLVHTILAEPRSDDFDSEVNRSSS